jgi:hypothetical protein
MSNKLAIFKLILIFFFNSDWLRAVKFRAWGLQRQSTYMLFTGCEVRMRKTVPEVLKLSADVKIKFIKIPVLLAN